jgi:hypothetical protein
VSYGLLGLRAVQKAAAAKDDAAGRRNRSSFKKIAARGHGSFSRFSLFILVLLLVFFVAGAVYHRRAMRARQSTVIGAKGGRPHYTYRCN